MMHNDPQFAVDTPVQDDVQSAATTPGTAFIAEGSILYVLATPLGNLRDLTWRARDILASADLILAEDTRVSSKLLSHYGLKKPMKALHQHNERQATAYLLEQLAAGKSIALISDAGTPAVSDPGARLVDAVHQAGHRVVPIPGASALTAAVSAAGLVAEHFYFAGFLPQQKKARHALLETLRPLNCALVFYEAPHRIRQTLADLATALPGERQLVIARELTKTFETITRMPLATALEWMDEHPETQRGEFVLLVDSATQAENTSDLNDPQIKRWLTALLAELPPARVAKIVSAVTGLAREDVYEEAKRRSEDR